MKNAKRAQLFFKIVRKIEFQKTYFNVTFVAKCRRDNHSDVETNIFKNITELDNLDNLFLSSNVKQNYYQ